MKHKIWLLQIPVVIAFCGLYLVGEMATEGKLDQELLRTYVYPVVRSVEGKFTDLKFRLRGPQAPASPVVIVEIDEDSIIRHGRWPWHRDTTAKLIDRIFDLGAKAVALDIAFPEPDVRISEELRMTLESLGQKSEFIEAFETDNELKRTIEKHREKLVLGYFLNACQPRYAKADCQLFSFDEIPTLPGDPYEPLKNSFDRFAIASVSGADRISRTETPFFSAQTLSANIPKFSSIAKSAGSLNAEQDPDGVIRRLNLLYYVDGKLHPNIGLALAEAALGERAEVKIDAEGGVESLTFPKLGKSVPVSRMGVLDLNFRGGFGAFPYLSADHLLSNDPTPAEIEASLQQGTTQQEIDEYLRRRRETKEALRDKVVLIGLSAVGAFDMRSFPFGPNIPGVDGHATTVDNILSDQSLIRASSPKSRVLLFLFMSVGALLLSFFVERLQSIASILIYLGTIVILGGVDIFVLFSQQRLNLNTGLLAVELSLIFVITMTIKYVMEEKNKKFIKLAFSKYVAPSIVDSILKDPTKLQVGGEKRDLTILFSDIRSFTSFSENMDAKQLSTFLNDYLGLMTELVFENDGTLDKYIGDAVMAFWGAPVVIPAHARKACEAAIRMQQVLSENRARFKTQYGVDVNVGIGINSGAVSVGNMGSERIFEYTVIGDHVNLASRLEGLTKYYGVKIVTTRFTFDEIEKEGGALPPHRVLDFVKVKGKKNAIELIQLLERELPPTAHEFFAKGRDYYRQRQWDDAIACFLSCSDLHEQATGEPDGAAQMFIERCQELKISPPDADWEGSWEMTSK